MNNYIRINFKKKFVIIREQNYSYYSYSFQIKCSYLLINL